MIEKFGHKNYWSKDSVDANSNNENPLPEGLDEQDYGSYNIASNPDSTLEDLQGVLGQILESDGISHSQDIVLRALINNRKSPREILLELCRLEEYANLVFSNLLNGFYATDSVSLDNFIENPQALTLFLSGDFDISLKKVTASSFLDRVHNGHKQYYFGQTIEYIGELRNLYPFAATQVLTAIRHDNYDLTRHLAINFTNYAGQDTPREQFGFFINECFAKVVACNNYCPEELVGLVFPSCILQSHRAAYIVACDQMSAADQLLAVFEHVRPKSISDEEGISSSSLEIFKKMLENPNTPIEVLSHLIKNPNLQIRVFNWLFAYKRNEIDSTVYGLITDSYRLLDFLKSEFDRDFKVEVARGFMYLSNPNWYTLRKAELIERLRNNPRSFNDDVISILSEVGFTETDLTNLNITSG